MRYWPGGSRSGSIALLDQFLAVAVEEAHASSLPELSTVVTPVRDCEASPTLAPDEQHAPSPATADVAATRLRRLRRHRAHTQASSRASAASHVQWSCCSGSIVPLQLLSIFDQLRLSREAKRFLDGEITEDAFRDAVAGHPQLHRRTDDRPDRRADDDLDVPDGGEPPQARSSRVRPGHRVGASQPGSCPRASCTPCRG